MPPKRNPAKEDPYPATKAHVEKNIRGLSENFEKWKYILEKKNTANTQEFHELTRSLRLGLKEITQEISSISKVNSVVESHRERFPKIDDAELHSRKAFVHDARTFLTSVQDYLDSERAKNKIKADEQRSAAGPVVLKPGQTGDQYVSHRQQQSRQMDDESDAVLEDMAAALERLHGNSRTINVKLHEQKEIISEMDDNIGNTQNLLDIAQEKVQKVLNKSTKAKWIILGFEFLIIVVFLILIIYT